MKSSKNRPGRYQKLLVARQLIQFITELTGDNSEEIWEYVCSIEEPELYNLVHAYFYFQYPATKISII